MNYLDIAEAREEYRRGNNITRYLRRKFEESENTSGIIEIAYDLQSGSYIDAVKADMNQALTYASELSDILNKHLTNGESLMDVGAGEITTLTLVLNKLEVELGKTLAFDISWSRLYRGIEFHRENNENDGVAVEAFVADMKTIPLHSKCIDVVTSSHALEPNGNNLGQLLSELFRVTKKKLVLFEPSYELNSLEGKQRMDSLGYIKNLEGEVEQLGGNVVEVIPIQSTVNPLNPTACYVIEPPLDNADSVDLPAYCVPGTNYMLERDDTFLTSRDTGLVFPILEEIPILRANSAILATAKF
jgi:ubiquinone/menaquinone biosynthesis C-methylase UbiE